MNILLLIGLIILSQASAQPQTPSSATSTAPRGNAQNGKRLFASYGCYECHGHAAQGSSATGPRLGPRPIAFSAFS
jgi:cytochrome c2